MLSVRFCVVAWVVLLAGWAVSSTTWASGTGPVCGPLSAPTEAGDLVARVYVSAGDVYGCVAGAASRSYLRGRRGSCLAPNAQAQEGAVGPVRLAGRVVAFASAVCGVDSGQTTVIVRRLTDGRFLHSRDATTRIGVEGHQDVGSLVVKDDGAVAWIATAESIGAPRFVRQLARLDKRGFRVLDSGPAVAVRSLTLRGSMISWHRGNGMRTADLH